MTPAEEGEDFSAGDGEDAGGGSLDLRELVRERERSMEESRREELAGEVPSMLPLALLALESVAEERLEGERKGEDGRATEEVGGKTRPEREDVATGLGLGWRRVPDSDPPMKVEGAPRPRKLTC